MSKFSCPCGQVISDTTYPRPNAGIVLKQMDEERFHDRVAADIAGFLSAVVSGGRDLWIMSRFGRQYPVDLGDAEIISDLMTGNEQDCVVLIEECEACGRLHVQDVPGSAKIVSFVPESGSYEGVLRGSPDSGE